jgi:hypothetical protein
LCFRLRVSTVKARLAIPPQFGKRSAGGLVFFVVFSGDVFANWKKVRSSDEGVVNMSAEAKYVDLYESIGEHHDRSMRER